MTKYIIKATIIKTIEAVSEEEAHDMFSVLCDDENEIYTQETIREV